MRVSHCCVRAKENKAMVFPLYALHGSDLCDLLTVLSSKVYFLRFLPAPEGAFSQS